MAQVAFEVNLSTLMPVLLGVTLLRFLVMGHYALNRKVYPGFRSFVYAEFFSLLGLAAIAARARLGEAVFAVFLSSVATLLHPALVYHGVGCYCRAPRLRAAARQNGVLVGLACLLQLTDLILVPDMTRRVLVYSATSCLLCLRIGLELPFLKRRPQPGVTLLCLSYLVVAGVHVARAASVLHQPGYDYAAMLLADNILAFYLFFRILQSMLELYVLFAMNSVMLEHDLRMASAQIQRMAQTDALTGALNRRGLEMLGAEALRKSFSQGQPAAVILLDLDWFKRVNDTLGHQAGDELLRAVSALCAGSLRAEDVFARYGGEEFVVVAPYTSASEARGLAERMRKAVGGSYFDAVEGQRVTASFGVHSALAGTLDELFEHADAALYQAKQAGRDRVVVSGDPHCGDPLVAEPADAGPQAVRVPVHDAGRRREP